MYVLLYDMYVDESHILCLPEVYGYFQLFLVYCVFVIFSLLRSYSSPEVLKPVL